MEWLKRRLLDLLGYYDWPDDLEDTVPDFIGVEIAGRFMYMTATYYGDAGDRQNVSIKLDEERLTQLNAVLRAVIEQQDRGEPASGPPTPAGPASPLPGPPGSPSSSPSPARPWPSASRR